MQNRETIVVCIAECQWINICHTDMQQIFQLYHPVIFKDQIWGENSSQWGNVNFLATFYYLNLNFIFKILKWSRNSNFVRFDWHMRYLAFVYISTGYVYCYRRTVNGGHIAFPQNWIAQSDSCIDCIFLQALATCKPRDFL